MGSEYYNIYTVLIITSGGGDTCIKVKHYVRTAKS